LLSFIHLPFTLKYLLHSLFLFQILMLAPCSCLLHILTLHSTCTCSHFLSHLFSFALYDMHVFFLFFFRFIGSVQSPNQYPFALFNFVCLLTSLLFSPKSRTQTREETTIQCVSNYLFNPLSHILPCLFLSYNLSKIKSKSKKLKQTPILAATTKNTVYFKAN
jgi:hypothetical protein